MVRLSNRLPGEMVEAPSLDMHKIRLNGTLKQTDLTVDVPARCRVVGRGGLYISLPPQTTQLFCDCR